MRVSVLKVEDGARAENAEKRISEHPAFGWTTRFQLEGDLPVGDADLAVFDVGDPHIKICYRRRDGHLDPEPLAKFDGEQLVPDAAVDIGLDGHGCEACYWRRVSPEKP